MTIAALSEQPTARFRLRLAALSLAMLLPSLGTSIANVALPTLSAAFHAPIQTVQWVVIAYLLAVTTLKRTSLFPDAPTIAEMGMPGFDVSAWQGLMVPANTPEAIIKRLNVEMRKALQNPEVLTKLAGQGAIPLGSTPQEYGDYIKSEISRWSVIVKQTGVTLE